MKGDGEIEEQAGSYSDWEARGGQLAAPVGTSGSSTLSSDAPSATRAIETAAAGPPEKLTAGAGGDGAPKKKTKLSYKDQRELDALPGEIESLEARHAELLEIIAQPGFYEQSPDDVATTLNAVTESEQALDRALQRLVELEG